MDHLLPPRQLPIVILRVLPPEPRCNRTPTSSHRKLPAQLAGTRARSKQTRPWSGHARTSWQCPSKRCTCQSLDVDERGDGRERGCHGYGNWLVIREGAVAG